MKIHHFCLILLISVLFFSCRDTGRDPLSEEELHILYAESQIHLIDFFEEWQAYTMEMSRMLPMRNSSYREGVDKFTVTKEAARLFGELSTSSRELIRSSDLRESYFISGSSKILRAFTYQMIIDLSNEYELAPVSGEVPSLNGNTSQGFYAGFPQDSNYMLSIGLLSEAVDDLEKSQESPVADLFFAGDANKWIRLANSLKLRAYNNTRLVDENAREEINKIIQDGQLIEDISEDFQYRYQSAPGREGELAPLFELTYRDNGDWQPPFMSNYFMWLLTEEKSVADPRSSFYFYRQVPDFTSPDRVAICPNFEVLGQGGVIPETPQHYKDIDGNMPYCIASEAGYYGRDHGNGMGPSDDKESRTLIGLYPFGGKFDDNSFERGAGNSRETGENLALLPMLHASHMYFIRAEAALTIGTQDNPIIMVEEGIRKSFEKVRSFAVNLDPDFRPDSCLLPVCESVGEILNRLQMEEENYINYVLDQYNRVATVEEKLDIIMKEYLIALWGNGFEAYNNYRRTAMPLNIQPLLDPVAIDPIGFPRVAPEIFRGFGGPLPYVNDTVFWDTNDPSLFR